MQTIQNRNSWLKQIHQKEIYGGYFAVVPSGRAGAISIQWRLDFSSRILFFTLFQTAVSTGSFRVANDLLVGDAGSRVINYQANTDNWSGNHGFNHYAPSFSSTNHWVSGREQSKSAESMFQFHRIVENKISADNDPEPNRSPIFTEIRILQNNAEG
jgi:hypothetical protein